MNIYELKCHCHVLDQKKWVLKEQIIALWKIGRSHTLGKLAFDGGLFGRNN